MSKYELKHTEDGKSFALYIKTKTGLIWIIDIQNPQQQQAA